MLTPQEVENLAELSRLALSAEEKTAVAKDLESILGYVSELQNAPTDESIQTSSHLGQNVMRADTEPHASGAHTEKILSQAPDQQDNFLKVKKILGTNDVA